MNAGSDITFCNLECWCHVPTRGVNKPPCYLCVINTCSLSSKQEVPPSAPELSPTEAVTPFTFQSPVGNGRSPSPLDANSHMYGWRGTITRNASVGLDERDFTTKLYVQLPPERNGGELVSEARNSSPNSESNDNNTVIPERNYSGAFDVSHMAIEESQEQADRAAEDSYQTTTSESEDSNKGSVTTIEVNCGITGASQSNTDYNHEGTIDLSDLIKSLVCDTEQEIFTDEGAETSERHIRPNRRSTNDRVMNTRRRRDRYHGFCNTGLRSCASDPAVMMAGQKDSQFNPTQNESEYQLLHKIHRRDTASDAARRYLQSDENLHRAWVGLKRVNYFKRNRSMKRFVDDGNQRCTFSYEGGWKDLQRHLSKDRADT